LKDVSAGIGINILMNQFSELTLNTRLQQNLARNGFITPTPVQAKSIPVALTSVDLVATAQTGTGKTLAFLIPIVQRLVNASDEMKSTSARALILAPTRELALQIVDSFSAIAANTGLRSAVVVGGLSEQKQLNTLRRGAHVVIATPGRLEDFLNRRLIDLSQISTLVLDEADRMLDMGFLPAIVKILKVLPASRQNLFFSATMDQEIERLIRRYSNNPVRITTDASTAKTPDHVDLHVYEIENDMRLGLLRHMLKQEEGSFLVFARTKHGTDRLAKRLLSGGVRAVAMHGDRTQNQRNQALAGFRDGRYRVLVATDVAARGIHVDSVAHVVNFDLPQASDDFVHRVGRTGRAGQRGSASTFASRAERQEIHRIERDCKIRMTRREISPGLLNEIAEACKQPDTASSETRSHKSKLAPAAASSYSKPRNPAFRARHNKSAHPR
jgi:ATP-dependent RNA helicase RhlE